MTPADRTARLATGLSTVFAARAVLWALAGALGAAAVVRLLISFQIVHPLGIQLVIAIASCVGAVAGIIALLTGGAGWRMSAGRAALWVEERVPGLNYNLVTASDPRFASALPFLQPSLAAIPWADLWRRAAVRALLPPATAVAAAALLLVFSGIRAQSLPTTGVASDAGARAPRSSVRAGSPLAQIRAVISPPAYSGLPRRTDDDPASISALVTSRIEVTGRGDENVSARVGERTVAVQQENGRWTMSLPMPASAALIGLSAGDEERLILLEPLPDSVPIVTLGSNVVDTVFRQPTGALALTAVAEDDLGLASSAWEYIVSSGSGESFSFRSGTWATAQHRGARRANLRATLSLDALQLSPGDVIHVRAVARDRNTATGPGVGASETRAVRIARAGEYDSLAIEGAPPAEADKSLISQRMLLILTERLEDRRPELERAVVLSESQAISVDQTTLRRRVGELVYIRLGEGVEGEHSHFAGDGHNHGPEGPLDPDDILGRASAATGGAEPTALDFHGDETPVVAVNRPLLDAYNHMWDASRALEQGEPGDAIPPMRLAVAALQRAREAERIYLRGRPPVVVVDLSRARLQGAIDSVDASPRSPREAVDAASAARADRLEAAILRLGEDPLAAVDSLLVLRVDAIGEAPALAAVLDEAIRSLRGGSDATGALRQARQIVLGEPHVSRTLPRWRGAW